MKPSIQVVLQGQIADERDPQLEKGIMFGVSPEQLPQVGFYRLHNDSLHVFKNKNASSLLSIIHQIG